MLSDMESSKQVPSAGPPSPEEAAAALREAETASRATMTGLVLPGGYSLITGSANAVAAYGVAVSNTGWRFSHLALAASLAVLAAAALVAKRRFQRRNGAWVNGFGGPRATWRAIAAFIVVFAGCVVGATALMVGGHPVWAALVALLALPLTAVADRWWMAAYRAAAREGA